MGNKIPDNKINELNLDLNSNSERNNSLYFDEISSYGKNKNKKKNNDNELNIEHNPLISQIKSDPFIDYEITKELGKGTFATVYLVKHRKSGAIRAMKEIQRDQEEDSEISIANEINILMKLDHPNIVKIFEFYVSPSTFYLITEYCPCGSLYDLIDKNNGPFTEIQTSYIMYQLFSAVNYFHKMKVIHRDLKPENILINKNENGFVSIKIKRKWFCFN